MRYHAHIQYTQCSLEAVSNQHVNKSPVLQSLPDERSEAASCRGKAQVCCSNCHLKGSVIPLASYHSDGGEAEVDLSCISVLVDLGLGFDLI